MSEAEGLPRAELIGVEQHFDYVNGRLFLHIFGYDELVLVALRIIGEEIAEFLDIEESKHD